MFFINNECLCRHSVDPEKTRYDPRNPNRGSTHNSSRDKDRESRRNLVGDEFCPKRICFPFVRVEGFVYIQETIYSEDGCKVTGFV